MLKAISQVQSNDRNQNQLQSNIISQLNTIVKNPVFSGIILSTSVSSGVTLSGVRLAVGSNTINHGLNRTLIGWFIVRQRSAGSIFDTQDSNTTPDLNLLLTSSAAVSVDIYVF